MNNNRSEPWRNVWYFVVGVLFLLSGSIAYILRYIAHMSVSRGFNSISWQWAAYVQIVLGASLVFFGVVRLMVSKTGGRKRRRGRSEDSRLSEAEPAVGSKDSSEGVSGE